MCTQLKKDAGINLFFFMKQIIPHGIPIKEKDCWRSLRNFAVTGYSNIDRRKVGTNLATHFVRSTYSQARLADPKLKKQFYDRSLFDALRTQYLERSDKDLYMDVTRRENFLSGGYPFFCPRKLMYRFNTA